MLSAPKEELSRILKPADATAALRIETGQSSISFHLMNQWNDSKYLMNYYAFLSLITLTTDVKTLKSYQQDVQTT